MDQLKLKHAKKAKADEGDQLVQPGRGRGRGRGRGCVVKDKSAGSEKGKPRKTKDSKKENKQSAMDGGAIFYGYTLDEWTAWDAACTWSQNYEHGKGFEVEAWDKVAILEQKKSIYELHQLGNEQAESAASAADAADAAEPKRRKKAPAELSKPAKGSTEKPSSSGSSKDKKIKAKDDSGSKRKKPKRGEAIEGDDTAGEAKEERKRFLGKEMRLRHTRNNKGSSGHATAV